jgi:hypothetical protein
VFIEVKTARVSSRAPELTPYTDPEPLRSLRARQRARIRRAAAAWLRGEVTGGGEAAGGGATRASPAARLTGRPTASEIRFDAIGVTIDARGQLKRLDHIEGAW